MDNNNQQKNKYDLRSKKQKKKKNSIPDSDHSESDDSDYDYEYEDDIEEEYDSKEFNKFLNKLFPSKYMQNKVIADENEDNEEDEEYEEDDEYEEDALTPLLEGGSKINIVFNISNPDLEEDIQYEYEIVDEEQDEEEEWETEEDDEKKEQKQVNKKSKKEVKDKDKEEKEEQNKLTIENIDQEKELLEQVKGAISQFKGKNSKYEKSSILDSLETFSKEQELKIKRFEKKEVARKKRNNINKFKKLTSEKNKLGELNYFNKLSHEDQKVILSSLKEINKYNKIDKPYRFKILELNVSSHLKNVALNKISALKYMEPGIGEYYKIKNWIDTFMTIPFNEYKSLSIKIDDGKDKCEKYMTNAITTLDNAVYGLNDAKMQILQMIGTWISNPEAIGNAIAIKGPPGTGKTTLIKEGISKILDRPFEFIALGGSTDSSFLEGHSYTYEGSTWGKIVSILIKSKCMNPIIYFDELDKVSETPKGDEIIGILTHLIDTSQNTEFHDKYFSEINFDLSKCLFIFSYNDEHKINPILKDRMYKIETKGYGNKEKVVITKDYLLPAIQQQINFDKKDIIIEDEIIHFIIDTYTHGEKGVRNLKRCLETIYTKLNIYRLTGDMKAELFKENMLKNVEFPFKVTREVVETLMIKPEELPFLTQLYC